MCLPVYSFDQAIYIFGLGIPLFLDMEIADRGKWRVWSTNKLLLTAAYGYILFVHFSKWRDKLPRKFDFLFSLLDHFHFPGPSLRIRSNIQCFPLYAARPAFYNYVIVMFVTSAVMLFACGLAGIRGGFGLWYRQVCFRYYYSSKINSVFSTQLTYGNRSTLQVV